MPWSDPVPIIPFVGLLLCICQSGCEIPPSWIDPLLETDGHHSVPRSWRRVVSSTHAEMPMTDSPTLRRETLRDELPQSIDMLRRCRARDIPAGYIDDYVALNWLEWWGGGLRVTILGENICRQVVSRYSTLSRVS